MPRPAAGVPQAPSSRSTRDRTKAIAPDGTYVLTVEGIRDLGWKAQRSFSGEDRPDAPQLRVRVSGVNGETGEVFTLARDIVHSYDPRSTLTALAAAILGIDPNDDDAEIDYRQLVRGKFLGEVKSRTYHPRDEDDERVIHVFTEWKGAPLRLPVGMQQSPRPQSAGVARSGQGDLARRSADGDPGPGGSARSSSEPAIKGSFITTAAMAEVGPIIRRVLDEQFDGNDLRAMKDYFRDVLERGDEVESRLRRYAHDILSFLEDRDGDRVVMSFTSRADADLRALGQALKAFEESWSIRQQITGEVDPDDLPFAHRQYDDPPEGVWGCQYAANSVMRLW